MRDRQVRLKLDTRYKLEELWDCFPERTQQQVIELYARLLARVAKERDAVSNTDKREWK